MVNLLKNRKAIDLNRALAGCVNYAILHCLIILLMLLLKRGNG
jgi:hypothetical protein